MSFNEHGPGRPRMMGAACAIGAVVLGLAYMSLAGAPSHYLGINLGALVVGLVMLIAIGRLSLRGPHWPGAMAMMMAFVLLATGLLGDPVNGAARWVQLGPLVVQPSLIFLPVMIVGFARSRDALFVAAIVVAAAAMAIQPDRAMAGMLSGGLGVVAVSRPDRFALSAFAASIIGFAATLARPDMLPAVPYVDQIFYTSFEVNALAGMAVLGGAALLLAPAILGLGRTDHRDVFLTFGAVWLCAILAAALGNYPTPVVGYGGSAVIGYVLSLAMLPRTGGSSAREEGAPGRDTSAPQPGSIGEWNIRLFSKPHRYWLLALLIAASLYYAWGQVTLTRGDQRVSFRAAEQQCGSSGPLRYCIYTADSGTNGDIVYHLHGRNLDEYIWNSDTYLTAMIQEQWQRHRVMPPTVVTLSYGGTWLLTPRGRQADSGLLDDLIARLPAIEARLGPPRRRMLLGESMGGLNVLVAGLSYPSRFDKVAALCPGVYQTSPFASLSTIRASMERTGASPKIALAIWLMGRKYVADEEEWHRISPLHLIERAGPDYPALYLSNGLYDGYGNFEGTQRLATLAQRRGVRTEWHPLYGGHCATDVSSLARFLLE